MTGGLVRNWMGAASAALFLFAVPSAARQIEAVDLYTLPTADIVILGEVHDNPLHHAHQAIAIGALAPEALVWEMLTPDAAARATPDARASYGTLRAALDWDTSGWPDFSLYYPLFTAAPDAAIIGADVPDTDIRRAYTNGAAAVFGPDATAYGLSDPLPETVQTALLTDLDDAHCGALPDDRLPAMAEVQRLRDATLARAAVTAHRTTGGPVVIIAGSGHARTDRGIPAYIAAAAPDLTVLSIGQTEAPPGTAPGPQPYDLWLVTAPHPRPDPCAAFR
jgi:uncharacterized iron-regulated protein